MQISSRQEFAAGPDQVMTMLTDAQFLENVAKATGAKQFDVTVGGEHTVTRRTFDTPAAASKFAGETLTIVEDVKWGQPAADGSREGVLELTAPGLPVTMHGTAHLVPAGEGTLITYAGDLKVNVPLIGKKLEQQAAPAITEGLEAQQREGVRWLAEH